MSHRLYSLTTSTPTEEKPLPNMPVTESPQTASPERGRLRKPLPSHARSASGHYDGPPQPSLQELQQGLQQQQGFATDDYRGVPSPLPPPPVITGSLPGSRASSQERSRPGTPNWSRPSTPTIVLPGNQSPMTPSSPVAPGGKEHKKKRSLFGGIKSDKDATRGPFAWIAGHPQRQPYDAESLFSGRPMQEMWDNSPDGNCYIYLFPRNSGKGASFKIDSAVFGSSPVLTKLAFGDVYSNSAIQNSGDRRHQLPLEARTQNLSLHDLNTPPATPPQPKRQPGTLDTMSSSSSRDSRGGYSTFSDSTESHLYIPIKFKTDGNVHIPADTSRKSKDTRDVPRDANSDDVQALIDIRNFFAFLCGQALVATERKHSFFHIFMTIAGILGSYEFTNVDGSTYGEVASSSFDSYVTELGLADVRSSREATIEGIVLGERMKSVLLYNEAFTHAAGKHEDLLGLRSPKYDLISSVTQTRLARAAMDLDKRTDSIRLILTDFDFPFLFIGTMSSKTSDERKEGVRFEAWKSAFLSFRKNYLGMLRNRYGNWPPKATSKKNNLETSGLNRSVLRDVYLDMCSIYDLLVDRTNLTTRTVDGSSLDGGAREEPTVRALRAVLSEYDRSSPPVKPPVPFDLPKLPTLKSTRPDFGRGDKRADIKAIQKKIKDDEIVKILRLSWNDDAFVTPFVDAFREMEKRAAHSCTIPELVDQRVGQWIFMYVVLQALPMLAVDAPGLKWTKGVEYFLCEPPRGGVPWANPDGAAGLGMAGARTWFSVSEGGGVVSLPADVVEHSVEGIYRRSHCWKAAENWTRENPIMNTALHEQEAMNNTMLPPSTRTSADGLPQPPSSNSLLSPDSGGGSRPSSRQSKRNSSLALGLEALPLPVGVTPDGSAPTGYSPAWAPGQNRGRSGSPGTAGGMRSGTPTSERPRSAHVVDSNKTFDAILASVGQDGSGDKKKKR